MLNYWMSLGIALPWLFAIGHGISRHDLWPKLLLVSLFVAIGTIQLAWYLLLQGQLQAHPWLLYIHQPALFLIGPCLYSYSEMLSHHWNRPPAHLYLHSIPFFAVLLISLAQWLGHDKHEMVHLSGAMVACSAALGSLYILPVIRRLWSARNPDVYIKVEMAVLTLLAAIGGVVALAALMGGLLDEPLFYYVYLSLITGLMVATYLLGIKYPELVHYLTETVQQTEEKPKYERSTLGQLPVQSLIDRMQQVMEEEQLYQDENLNLSALASVLSISPHQLSELLNEKLGKNFSRYLKECRVARASMRLISEPDEPILDIGFAVGFSSSSAFYAAFREIEGMPPGQYRKQHLQQVSA